MASTVNPRTGTFEPANAIESIGVHGSMCVMLSGPYSAGSVPLAFTRAMTSLTPSAYADRYSRLCGEMMANSCSATRRQPSVHRYRSVSTWPGPNSSASRPAVTWRRKSISQNRSWACT